MLTPDEGAELEARIRRYTSPHFEVIRAKIALLAAEGLGNDAIAKRVDLPRQVVSNGRRRFYRHRLGGLEGPGESACTGTCRTTGGVSPANTSPQLRNAVLSRSRKSSLSGSPSLSEFEFGITPRSLRLRLTRDRCRFRYRPRAEPRFATLHWAGQSRAFREWLITRK